MSGLYTAADMITFNFTAYHQAVGRAGVWVPVIPWHETSGRHTVPRPTDYNFLYRLISQLDWKEDAKLKVGWDLVSRI